MINVTLQMHNWHIEDKTPYISIGKAGENNAVTIFLKGDDLIYANPEENLDVEYFLDICDENDIMTANTQAFTQSEDDEGNVIFSTALMREFIGREGVKRLQVRCVVTNDKLEEIGTYESNVFHAIVRKNSGFGYKYDLAYFQQMVNNLKLTIETSLQNIMQDIMKKSVYDKNLNGIVDNAEKVVNPLVIYQNEEGTDVVTYDGSRQVSINISNTGGGGGGGGTTNYNMLNNKPSINGVVLENDKTNLQLGIPTKTSDLNNDSGFLTTNDVYTKIQTYNKTELDDKFNLKANESDLSRVAFTGSYDDLADKPTGNVTGVKGSAEVLYRQGNVNITKDNIGLGNVGNFKAVSTVANQGLTEEEKANARANIGAGDSGFDGDYNHLINKPDLGTSASKDVAESGDASTTQVVKGDDTRLTNARPASDVSAWAKAPNKPAYTASEVGTYNKSEIDNMIASVTQQLDWKPSVETYNDIATTYPNPQDGWTVVVRDTNYTYRFNGTEWVNISANSIPNATTTVDGLMTSDKVIKLNSIESGAQVNTVLGVKGGAETDYRQGNVNITKENIGLGNVPNVSTNNQTVTYSDASTLANLVSGESLAVAFSKIKKAISELISHIGNMNNPHNVTASQLNLADVATSGSYNDLTDIPPSVSGLDYTIDGNTHGATIQNSVDTWIDNNTTYIPNVATGLFAHVEGFSDTISVTTASGKGSHAEGYGATASGECSHAENINTEASAYSSHAEGYLTTASNHSAHAEGRATTASGEQSHAEGYNSTASGNISHAEGYNSNADGRSSHAEGEDTDAMGDHSHAEGYGSAANGDDAHAEGHNTIANEDYSHAEGNTTQATGYGAHAEGNLTIASGDYSHAQGYNTESQGKYQTVLGKYNVLQGGNGVSDPSNTDYALIIGNGTASNARSNALAVKWNGNIVFADGTELTPNEILNIKNSQWKSVVITEQGVTTNVTIEPFTVYIITNRVSDINFTFSTAWNESPYTLEAVLDISIGNSAPTFTFPSDLNIDMPIIEANSNYECSVGFMGLIGKKWSN